MSLRVAVITRLRVGDTAAGPRVFQAFLAPANVTPPYITVKLATRLGGVRGMQPVECYLYAGLTSFGVLDTLEQSVLRLLHRQDLVDSTTGQRYHLTYASSAGDGVDNDNRLLNRVITFNAANVAIT